VDQWPYVPGKQYVDWDLTDPAGKGQDEVRAIRGEIERRVGELPL
jgi:arsenate reductase